MTRARRQLGPLLALLTAVLCIAAANADAALPLGQLTQLPGTAGCFTYNGASEDGAGTCSIGVAVAAGDSPVISPDGKNLYLGSYPGTSPTRPASIAVFSRDISSGQLSQLPGTAGCFTTDGSSLSGPGTCTEARGLLSNVGDGRDIAFTSDGLFAYVVAQNNTPAGAVLSFRRDPSTGALTQLPGTDGCISANGSSQDGAGTCATDATLAEPMGISISADDRFVYVTDYGHDRIHVYSRGSSGALTAIQCLAQAPAPTGCTEGRVLGNSQSVVISPGGQHAYSGEYGQGLSIFDRDPASGLLTQKAGNAGCITYNGVDNKSASTCDTGRRVQDAYAISISPDGQSLYDTDDAGGFSAFHINADGTLTQLPGTAGCGSPDGKDEGGASTCTVTFATGSTYGSAISPDGKTLYLSDRTNITGGLAVMSLDSSSGVANQFPGLAGCLSSDGTSDTLDPGTCTNDRATAEGYGITVSPDGHFVYQATESDTNAGLAIFKRATAPACNSGSTAVTKGKSATVALTCVDADGDPVARAILSSPAHGTLGPVSDATGTVTYTPTTGYTGPDSFTFDASDGVNTGNSATASLVVAPPKFRGSKLASRTLIVDAKGNVTVKLTCPAGNGTCRDTVSIFSSKGTLPHSAKKKKRAKATLLGRKSISVRAGKTLTKRFRLNKAGRKLAKAHKSFHARLILKSHGAATASVSHSYKVTIKRAKSHKKHKH
jgi:6-phosphogluconolactonase (cycloisomerase 2 family)